MKCSKTSKALIRVALLCMTLIFFAAMPQPSSAQVAIGVAVGFAPPDLPVYAQPLCPGADYIWVPGYWAWDADFDDYFWVPGTWVLAPEPGFFWTPGYWAWIDDAYYFQAGYWGPVVGFYGGIDYGFGYFGTGYLGGRWEGRHFYYNTAVNNVNVTVIHNTYVDRTVIVNRTESPRVSFNGPNGVNARPTPEQERAAHERHVGPVAAQMKQRQEARSNRDLRASVNHGRPPIAATPKPAAFKGNGVVPAREGGTVHTRAEARGGNAAARGNNGRPAIHPNELPPPQPAPAPHTGNAKQDQKYEKQQQKILAQQEKQRQKLQQQQDKEHARLERQRASEQQRQQMEQRHQQQTQQMQQRQEQQRQNTERREEPPARPPSRPERPPR